MGKAERLSTIVNKSDYNSLNEGWETTTTQADTEGKAETSMVFNYRVLRLIEKSTSCGLYDGGKKTNNQNKLFGK